MDERSGDGKRRRAAPSCQRRLFARPKRRTEGFTMVELIVTIMILGILAATILPRFADRGVFEARGFRDESIAFLRWAQKSAVAQRRTVCVYFTAADAWAHIRSAANDVACGVSAGPADALPAGQVWLNSANGGLAAIHAPDTAGYAAAPAAFSFLASGSPSLGQGINVTGSGGLTVEAVTGYVH